MKRVRQRQGVVLKLLLAVFVIYASVQIADLQLQIAQKKRTVEQYEAQNAELEVQNQTIQNDLDNGLSDEQVAKIAQEKLGLVERFMANKASAVKIRKLIDRLEEESELSEESLKTAEQIRMAVDEITQ